MQNAAEPACRTFFHDRQPVRSKRTAIEFAVVAAISAASWWLAWRYGSQPGIGTLAIIVGIVTLAIGGSLAWHFIIGAVVDIRATEEGIDQNGQFWPWAQVIRLRATVTADGAWGSVTVRRRGRSAMAIPFAIAGQDAESLEELREYLIARGYDLDWRVRQF